jgi:hypothetical protein
MIIEDERDKNLLVVDIMNHTPIQGQQNRTT